MNVSGIAGVGNDAEKGCCGGWRHRSGKGLLTQRLEDQLAGSRSWMQKGLRSTAAAERPPTRAYVSFRPHSGFTVLRPLIGSRERHRTSTAPFCLETEVTEMKTFSRSHITEATVKTKNKQTNKLVFCISGLVSFHYTTSIHLIQFLVRLFLPWNLKLIL